MERWFGLTARFPEVCKGDIEMKNDIHPDYNYVVFRDEGAEFDILTRSTMTSPDTVKWEDGNTYPLIRLELSSASHPFYTGKQKIVDTAGRVERFEKRYGRRKTK